MTWKITTPSSNPQTQRGLEWCVAMLNASVATAALIGCTPEAIGAPAALETGWGRAAIGNNVFGIKCGPNWTGKRQLVTTREYSAERGYYIIQDWFRDYPTMEEGIDDHFQFLKRNTRYADVFDPNNTMTDHDYFSRMAADGYATDADYANKLDSMLESVRLYESQHMANV